MDQLDIYVNVEELSKKPGKTKGVVKRPENNKIHSLEPNTTGTALSGAGDVKKSSCRGAAIFLGLLCLLLLAGLLTLVFLFTKSNSKWEMEMNQLQTSYNNLSKVRDQLQKEFEDRKAPTGRSCCEGWTKFGTSCYYVSKNQKTWEDSRGECQRKGADLVIINNEEENKFVIQFKKRVWIGLTDKDEEGVWKWVDGTNLTTSYWCPPQPDNFEEGGKKEDCAEIYTDYKQPLLKWNDVYCSHNNYWVCEMN